MSNAYHFLTPVFIVNMKVASVDGFLGFQFGVF